MTELDLAGLRRQAGSWHKVLQVERRRQQVVVTVVRALSLRGEPSVVTDQFQLAASPDLEAYLSSAEFKRKLFLPSRGCPR